MQYWSKYFDSTQVKCDLESSKKVCVVRKYQEKNLENIRKISIACGHSLVTNLPFRN